MIWKLLAHESLPQRYLCTEREVDVPPDIENYLACVAHKKLGCVFIHPREPNAGYCFLIFFTAL